jgi:prepilin-type N-terminal cleavage/methylation domain-containing protein
MSDLRGSRRAAGFTLIELLVVLAIAGVLLFMTVPPLHRFMYRGKIEGTARQTAALMQMARLEALKRNIPARVALDFDKDQVYAFADLDRDGAYDIAKDRELGRITLPRNVAFQAAEDGAPEAADALVKFDDKSCAAVTKGGCEDFNPDGTAANSGAVRFGDARGNFLEVRVTSVATGKIEIRKYDPASKDYWLQGEVGGHGGSWEWY